MERDKDKTWFPAEYVEREFLFVFILLISFRWILFDGEEDKFNK